ncbi:ankyrin repeat domain-containing protein SOWAHD [Gadus morhua]|uniref:Sosondowah ankyrin repeat domain family member D n=1 Tax=Gadus morhua TaxID=8049 RepID=A0A8C4ZXX9_GADMO|nr:ankyrin repeat domain-containing protein SOWAHD [Gadus morhua]
MEGEMNEYSSSPQNDVFAGEERSETTCNVTEDPIPSPTGPWTSRGALARLSRYGKHILPNSFSRRSGLQRQLEVSDSTPGALHGYSADAPERGSLTPAMRKKYLKELLFNNTSNTGFGCVLSTNTTSTSSRDEQDTQRSDWALYPMEHAWMMSAVDGNYEAIFEFIADDPYLLTRKDFISGFSVLHWLAKSGHGETLTKLLKHAENVGSPADVNLRGSGGLTPLHVASMHSQFMVVKLLVGAFGAKVDVMDYNGKRAWQYLKGNAPLEMKELLGAWDEEHNTDYAQNANNSASCMPNPTPSVDPRLDEVDSPNRTRAEGRLVTSLRDVLQAFKFWGNKLDDI